MLIVFIGKVVVNINGIIFYLVFNLLIKDKLNKFEYKKFGIENLNRLWSNYINVKFIIVDEIFMFGVRSLLYLYLIY